MSDSREHICHVCARPIEHAQAAGTTIQCPHCSEDTTVLTRRSLAALEASAQAPVRKRSLSSTTTVLIQAGTLLALVLLLGGIFLKASRTKMAKTAGERAAERQTRDEARAEAERQAKLKPLPPVDPNRLVAEGTLLFDGEKLETKLRPYFHFEADDNPGALASNPSPRVDYEDGEFQVFGLPPGRYRMHAWLDVPQRGQNYLPGTLSGTLSLTIGGPSATSDARLHLSQTIHLTRPVDNSNRLTLPSAPAWEHREIRAQSLLVTWGSVRDEAEYAYRIDRCGHKPWQLIATVARGTTRELFVDIPLPPSEREEHYELRLSARNDGIPIGEMRILQPDGETVSGYYPFRMAPAAAPAVVPAAQPGK